MSLGRSCSPQRFRQSPRRLSDLERCSTGAPQSGCFRAGTNGISQVPRRPIPHLCRALRPRLNRSSWPCRISRCCPRSQHGEGFSAHMISRLTHGFGTRCLRFTSNVAATHARLASGWRAPPLPGGRRTLWVTKKGFRLHPSSFPGLTLTQAGRMSAGVRALPGARELHSGV